MEEGRKGRELYSPLGNRELTEPDAKPSDTKSLNNYDQPLKVWIEKVNNRHEQMRNFSRRDNFKRRR